MATIADQVISALTLSGVRRVYGLPGDSLNGFTDAIRRSGDIAWEHVRHEETAAFAAAADAALTGQLAVCAGSCEPGNTHLVRTSLREALATADPHWWTCGPTPTRSPSRRTSPPSRSAGSPWRACGRCSPAASARW